MSDKPIGPTEEETEQFLKVATAYTKLLLAPNTWYLSDDTDDEGGVIEDDE